MYNEQAWKSLDTKIFDKSELIAITIAIIYEQFDLLEVKLSNHY